MKIHTTPNGKEELTIIPLAQGYDRHQLPRRIRDKIPSSFKGKADEQHIINATNPTLLIGTGTKDDDALRKVAGKAYHYAKDTKTTHYLLDMTFHLDDPQIATEGTLLAAYTYQEFKKPSFTPKSITLITQQQKAGSAIKKGRIISEGVNLVRDLVNRPSSKKTPTAVAKLAKELGERYGFNVRVLGKKQLQKERMNAMLSVARGSDKEPQLVILELNKNANAIPLALVGKGVTFDAGGLQLKPDPYIREMKMDLGGAATVLGTIVTLARLGHQGKVIGYLGLVENLLGPDAYKPGDIIPARNGKTIEIEHTDAEGRLVLADVLNYAEETARPGAIIDLATLTGAAIVALGYRVAPLLGNNKELIAAIKEASERTDELVWELPLYAHYGRMMEGTISDLRNLGKKLSIGGPGTITAAAFLEAFINEKTRWAHLDIAGTAFSYEKTAYTPRGGTGWGVRLLTDLIQHTLKTNLDFHKYKN